MNKKTFLVALVVLLPTLMFFSCNKEDAPDSAVVTRDWHGVAYGVDNNGNGIVEPNEITNNQILYQHFIFNTDGSGRFYDNSTENVNLQWALLGNHMQIVFEHHLPTFDTNLFHIDSLSIHYMILSDTNNQGHWEWHSFAR